MGPGGVWCVGWAYKREAVPAHIPGSVFSSSHRSENLSGGYDTASCMQIPELDSQRIPLLWCALASFS